MSTRPVPIHQMKDSAAAAEKVARFLAGSPEKPKTRVLRSLRGVRERVVAGDPVMLTGPFPTKHPDVDGYWLFDADGHDAVRTVVVVGYSPAREAFRIVESRGVGWGQAGRAWLKRADVEQILKRGHATVMLRAAA